MSCAAHVLRHPLANSTRVVNANLTKHVVKRAHRVDMLSGRRRL